MVSGECVWFFLCVCVCFYFAYKGKVAGIDLIRSLVSDE